MIFDGYTLWARQTLESDVFRNKPDKWFKIFFFLVMRANFKDNDKWKRGEALTSYTEIAEFTGANRNEIDHCLRWLKFGRMLATRKATRGFHFTIVKYEQYQDSATYKATPKAIEKRHRSDTIKNKDKKDNNIMQPSVARAIPSNIEVMADKRRQVHIIGLYWNYLDMRFDNYGQYDTQLKKNLRVATALANYTDDQILDTMKYFDKNWKKDGKPLNWHLNTVLNNIQELINNKHI